MSVQEEIKMTNDSIISEVASQQKLLMSKMRLKRKRNNIHFKLLKFLSSTARVVAWEYARTEKLQGRHGTILFDKSLIDHTDGAFQVG